VVKSLDNLVANHRFNYRSLQIISLHYF